MASPEWLEIFGNWDDAKITGHIAKLEEQISVFTSQGVGQKNYQKDLGELRGQLSAAYRVLKQGGGNKVPSVILTDFSRVNQR